MEAGFWACCRLGEGSLPMASGVSGMVTMILIRIEGSTRKSLGEIIFLHQPLHLGIFRAACAVPNPGSATRILGLQSRPVDMVSAISNSDICPLMCMMLRIESKILSTSIMRLKHPSETSLQTLRCQSGARQKQAMPRGDHGIFLPPDLPRSPCPS